MKKNINFKQKKKLNFHETPFITQFQTALTLVFSRIDVVQCVWYCGSCCVCGLKKVVL
jgi:hypothetical protein